MSGFAVEFVGCAWTEAVSGQKNLRIQKYPDTCGRGLSTSFFLSFLLCCQRVVSFICQPRNAREHMHYPIPCQQSRFIPSFLDKSSSLFPDLSRTRSVEVALLAGYCSTTRTASIYLISLLLFYPLFSQTFHVEKECSYVVCIKTFEKSCVHSASKIRTEFCVCISQ